MSYHEDHLATEIGPFGRSADAQDPAFNASEVPDIERKRPDDPKGLSRPDPAQGRQRPPGVEPEPGWPDIREFSAQSPSQEDYPLAAFPDPLRAVLESAAASCGASVPTTAACLLGSLATLAQHDFAVRLLAPRPVPLSLSIVAVSESGWRKSTVGELLMSSHVAADTAIARIHARAKASLSPRGGRSQAEDEIKPRRHSPIALRYDITTEGLLSRLEGGRPTQALFNTEAGIQVRNWSFSGSQKARTLGVLNNLWDGTTTTFDRTSAGGREYRISHCALSICWFGQRHVLEPSVTDDSALLGFSARTLVSRDDARPQERHYADAPTRDRIIRAFHDRVLQERQRQDQGMELAPPPDAPPWTPVHMAVLSPRARDALAAFNAEMSLESDSLREHGDLHESTFAARATEQAGRIAAIFAAWRAYTGSEPGRPLPPEVTINEVEIRSAIQLTRWYWAELSRIAGQAGWEERTQAVHQMVHVFRDKYEKISDKNGLVNPHRVIAQYGPAAIRKDLVKRSRVIEMMVQAGIIRLQHPQSRRYALNPGLRIQVSP